MLVYFVIFIVMAAFMIKYPNYLKSECFDPSAGASEIQKTIDMANLTLGKTCRTYFSN